MIRPRLTLARLALAGAGLVAAAGLGAAAVPQVLAAAPAAATSTSPSPATTPVPVRKGAHPKHHRAGAAVRHLLVKLVAKDTGMTVQQVHAQLKAGRSLDAVAGSSAQAVRDAALDAVTRRVDAARARGRITPDQAATLLARAKDRIARVMAATPQHPGATAPA